MSYYYDQKQPPVGVPPAQGYQLMDAYPPPGYPQGYPLRYAARPQRRQDTGFLEGCLAAFCCCYGTLVLLDACF